jgi:hypothetical protein
MRGPRINLKAAGILYFLIREFSYFSSTDLRIIPEPHPRLWWFC